MQLFLHFAVDEISRVPLLLALYFPLMLTFMLRIKEFSKFCFWMIYKTIIVKIVLQIGYFIMLNHINCQLTGEWKAVVPALYNIIQTNTTSEKESKQTETCNRFVCEGEKWC